MAACGITPNPASPKHKLANPGDTVYDVPIYSHAELYAKFPGQDYSGLKNLYVSPSGSDEGGAGSQAAPYATIGHALSVADAGTVIRIRAGTYIESLDFPRSGTFEKPIVLYSEDGRGEAKLDGGGFSTAIQSTVDYTIVDGLDVFRGKHFVIGFYSKENETGILPADEVGGKYNVVRNSIVHDAGVEGIKGAGIRYLLLENNEIYDVHGEEAFDCVACYHLIVQNNIFRDCAKGAAYAKGGSANVYFIGNTFYNFPTQQYALMLGGWSDLTSIFRGIDPKAAPEAYEQVVYNNVFYGAGRAAIMIVSGEKLKIYNNTFHNTATMKDATIVVVDDGTLDRKPSSEISVVNNLVHNSPGSGLGAFYLAYDPEDELEILHHHNVVTSNNSEFSWGFPDGPGDGDIQGEIIFVDAEAGDFRLESASAGVDSGVPVDEVSEDKDGVPRPQGQGPDRGAYER